MSRKSKGKLSMNEAAFRLLASEGRPMHYEDITGYALKRRMIQSCGLTPAQSMLAGIRREIKNKGTRSRFTYKGIGIYGLSRYGKRLAKKPRA